MHSATSFLSARCKAISDSPRFQSFILSSITMTAIVMGLETSEFLVDYYAAWFDVFFIVIQLVFCAEIVIRVLAYGPAYLKFFQSGWNSFDFAVVAISLLPVAGPFALIARFARIIRVARIVSSSHHLKDFIVKIYDSVDIMFQACIVAAVFYYMFAIGGFYLFASSDPDRWGDLGSALLTLLKVALFQDWGSIVIATNSGIYAWLFVIAFVGLNIALAANFLAATVVDHFHDHARRENSHEIDVVRELDEIRARLAAIQNEITRRTSSP